MGGFMGTFWLVVIVLLLLIYLFTFGLATLWLYRCLFEPIILMPYRDVCFEVVILEACLIVAGVLIAIMLRPLLSAKRNATNFR